MLLRIIPPAHADLRNPDRLYRSFMENKAGTEKVPDLTIRLQTGGFPSLAGLKKKFDTRESWSMFQDQGHSWIAFHPSQRAEPHWIARFDRPVRRVTVYCKAKPPASGKGRPMLDQPVTYPLDQLLLMHYFASRHGILVHAAGVKTGSRAYLFAGASGAGKSTFATLLAEARIGKMLSDERVVVREIDGNMIAFGTPWAGTAGIAGNASAPLAGIFFLRHGKGNRIGKLTAAEALDRFLPMVSVPWYDPDSSAPIIAFAKRVFARIPACEFHLTPDAAAIGCFREFLIGKRQKD